MILADFTFDVPALFHVIVFGGGAFAVSHVHILLLFTIVMNKQGKDKKRQTN